MIFIPKSSHFPVFISPLMDSPVLVGWYRRGGKSFSRPWLGLKIKLTKTDEQEKSIQSVLNFYMYMELAQENEGWKK